jgi:hypothetical protein
MNQRPRILGIAAIFIVGCAVGGAASHLVVPTATAQQRATLARWQYVCVELEDARELTDYSNRLGAESWEMVGGSGMARSGGINNWEKMLWCYKRPVP